MNKLFFWGVILFHIYIYYNHNYMSVNASKSMSYNNHHMGNSKTMNNDNSTPKCPIKLAKSFFRSSLFLNSLFMTKPSFKSMTNSIMKKNLNLIDFTKDSNILGWRIDIIIIMLRLAINDTITVTTAI